MLECFFTGQFGEFLQKRKVVRAPFLYAQRAFAGRIFQLRSGPCPMDTAEGAAIQMLLPVLWKPAAYRHALEICAEVDTPIFPDASCSFAADVFFVSFVRCQTDTVNRHQSFCDENVGA